MEPSLHMPWQTGNSAGTLAAWHYSGGNEKRQICYTVDITLWLKETWKSRVTLCKAGESLSLLIYDNNLDESFAWNYSKSSHTVPAPRFHWMLKTKVEIPGAFQSNTVEHMQQLRTFHEIFKKGERHEIVAIMNRHLSASNTFCIIIIKTNIRTCHCCIVVYGCY